MIGAFVSLATTGRALDLSAAFLAALLAAVLGLLVLLFLPGGSARVARTGSAVQALRALSLSDILPAPAADSTELLAFLE